MKMTVDPENLQTWSKGRVNALRLDAVTASELAAQQASDHARAMQDAARYARRIWQRFGLTQRELSQRIDVLLETIRNWEQGKRIPTGAAKALLRVLDQAPEAALVVLG